jgi:hypothetical protein
MWLIQMFLMLLLSRLKDSRELKLGFVPEKSDEFDLVTSMLSLSSLRTSPKMRSNTSK